MSLQVAVIFYFSILNSQFSIFLSAIAEAFEVLITTLHEAVIDILYPILAGEDEAEADGDEHQGGDGFAKQHVEQGIEL